MVFLSMLFFSNTGEILGYMAEPTVSLYIFNTFKKYLYL